ncbi:MAG: hypothetical protein WC717_04135 [Candidatus Micrarchaeia archaeon]|jgi:hypothetical protein
MLFAPHFKIEQRALLAVGFVLASFALVFMGFDREAAGYLRGMGLAGAAIAGAFYTLGATTPIAMVVLLEMMQMGSPYAVAVAACLSATLVDCLLFAAIRETLEKNTRKIMKSARKGLKRFPTAAPVAGFFVFGLPLPDELGLALMEFTTIDIPKLAAVIFAAKLLTLFMFFAALSS